MKKKWVTRTNQSQKFFLVPAKTNSPIRLWNIGRCICIHFNQAIFGDEKRERYLFISNLHVAHGYSFQTACLSLGSGEMNELESESQQHWTTFRWLLDLPKASSPASRTLEFLLRLLCHPKSLSAFFQLFNSSSFMQCMIKLKLCVLCCFC